MPTSPDQHEDIAAGLGPSGDSAGDLAAHDLALPGAVAEQVAGGIVPGNIRWTPVTLKRGVTTDSGLLA